MNRKHVKIHLTLISILMLVGQLGVLAHSVEHPFHAQDESCQIFLQCEKSGDGLVSLSFPLLLETRQTQPASQMVDVWLALSLTPYSARAPPPLS
ncbi:MAG: hypothetical protein KUG72_01700 [Pseudomonadales bacterium]|nr:hypothetical protein [Pseudomonadales bacterium]